MTTVEVLERELYTEPQAARLLGVPASTLHYWLEGGKQRGVVYEPVLRRGPRGNRLVTWAEFIEAGWLSMYRRDKKIPMRELRAFITKLRDDLGVPYPLADQRPLVSGRQLVVEAQEAAGLAGDFQLVVPVQDGQLMLSYAGERFLERVAWDGQRVAGWRPHSPGSPVLVRPDVRFGRPSVGGVSTMSVFELSEAGASAREIAQDFGLSVPEVRWALAYEEERHAV